MGRNPPGIQRSLGQRIPPAGTALAGVAAKGADTLTPADLAQTLRNATREAHHALDHHPLLAPLVRRDLNEKAYANALAALSAPHQWVEQMLGGFAPNPPFTPRWPRLCMDLQWLGRPSLPLGATPPPLVSPAEKLGALYVLEGSRLGAAAIARVIARNLPDKVPTHFFSPASADDQWALVMAAVL